MTVPLVFLYRYQALSSIEIVLSILTSFSRCKMYKNAGTFVFLVWFAYAFCSPLVNDQNGASGSTQSVTNADTNATVSDTETIVSSESILNTASNGSERAKEVEDMDDDLQNAKKANNIGLSSSTLTSQSSAKSTSVTVPKPVTKHNETASSAKVVTDASKPSDKTVKVTESSNISTTKNTTVENDYDDSHNESHDVEGVKNYFLSKMTFLKNDFFLSIIEPIVIGLGCALFILTLFFVVRWTKNTCPMRRMTRPKMKMRGDIRKMKQSDRIKLLAQSSDDEF